MQIYLKLGGSKIRNTSIFFAPMLLFYILVLQNKKIMKYFAVLIFSLFGSAAAFAQYSNSAWEGLYKLPEETKMILRFTTDSLLLQEPSTGENFEVMHYTVKNDTLTFYKVSGNSNCADEKGVYKLAIKDGQLFMTLINDDCPGRADAIPFEGLKKIE